MHADIMDIERYKKIYRGREPKIKSKIDEFSICPEEGINLVFSFPRLLLTVDISIISPLAFYTTVFWT